MANYVLSCCSTVDLSEEHLKSRGISCICYSYMLDGEQYIDDFGKTIPYEEFYRRLSNGSEPHTSQINADTYAEYFSSLLEKGMDVLHISMSSGITGSVNSACIARDEVQAKYPDRKIFVVDSLGASSGYGLLVDAAADMRDGGMEIEELRNWVEENKLNLQHWFFSTDLSFYVKGGRISKASGWFGTMLKICPLMNMDDLGRLIPRFKVRSKHKAMRLTLETMLEHVRGGADYDGKCFISNSGCPDDARELADMVEAAFPKLNGKVLINSIGTTVGSHTGPGTVALFFWGDKRER